MVCVISSTTDAASIAASNVSAAAHDSLDVPESRLAALEDAVKVRVDIDYGFGYRDIDGLHHVLSCTNGSIFICIHWIACV